MDNVSVIAICVTVLVALILIFRMVANGYFGSGSIKANLKEGSIEIGTKAKNAKNEILKENTDNDTVLKTLSLSPQTNKDVEYSDIIAKYKKQVMSLKNKYANKTIYIGFLYIVLKWEKLLYIDFRKTIYKNGLNKLTIKEFEDYKEDKINNIILKFDQLLQIAELDTLRKKSLSNLLGSNMLMLKSELSRIFDGIRSRHIEAENYRISRNDEINSLKNSKPSFYIVKANLDNAYEYHEALREIEEYILYKDLEGIKVFILGVFLNLLESKSRGKINEKAPHKQ